jgi:hypothetical protein
MALPNGLIRGKLQQGDIFTTINPMWLGRAICAVQKFNDIDNAASYSHAGIILGPTATTFEALWRNGRQELFNAYAGKQILIGRHESMNPERFKLGWNQVAHMEGKWYAGHRLFLMLIPPLAKYLASGKFCVCSEIAAKFLKGCKIMTYWAGVTPDHIADVIHNYKGWSTVFEGTCPDTLQEFERLPLPETRFNP